MNRQRGLGGMISGRTQKVFISQIRNKWTQSNLDAPYIWLLYWMDHRIGLKILKLCSVLQKLW